MPRSSSVSSTSSSSSSSYRSSSRRRKSSRHSSRSRKKHKKRSKKSSKKSDRRRSPSEHRRSRRRSRSRHRSSSPLHSRKRDERPLKKEPVVISEADRIKRNKDIESVENDAFEQGAFVTSASLKRHEESVKEKNGTEDFQFGTSVEKKVLRTVDSQGLCHPIMFANPDEREEKWLQNLFKLRRELGSSK